MNTQLSNINNTMKNQSVFVVSNYAEIDGEVQGFVNKVFNTKQDAIAYLKHTAEEKRQKWIEDEKKALKERFIEYEIEVKLTFNNEGNVAVLTNYSYGSQNFIKYSVYEEAIEMPIVDNAEQHVLDVLKVSDFAKFLQDISKRFDVSIEELLPSDYDLRHIDNIDYIERTLVDEVMLNLFESFKKRNLLTEYIAYTTRDVDTAKVYFLGDEVNDLSELIDAETYLNRHSDNDPNFRENVSKEFKLLVGINAPIVSDEFIAFKLKRFTDEIMSRGIDKEFVKGSLTYYVNVDMLKGMSRQEFDNFVKTYFDNECIEIVSVNSKKLYEAKKSENVISCVTFDNLFDVINKECKSHKEKRVYVFNINCSDEGFEGSIDELSNEDFIRFAEEDGRIYSSIDKFIHAFNYNEVSTDCDYVRIIEVDVFDE